MVKLYKKTVEYYSFYCPGCKHQHSYPVNSDGSGWQFNGSLESPSFTPSLDNTVKVKNEITGVYDVLKSKCHLIMTDGKIQFLSDCTHELAGQTVELPNIE